MSEKVTYQKKNGKVYRVRHKTVYRDKDGGIWDDKRNATAYNTDPIFRVGVKAERVNNLQEVPLPFIEKKQVKLSNAGRATGAVISTNQLDSIAKYARKANLDIPTAMGLAIKESTLGNPTDTRSFFKLRGEPVDETMVGQHIQNKDMSWTDRGFVNFYKDLDDNPYENEFFRKGDINNLYTTPTRDILARERYADRKAVKYNKKYPKGKTVMQAGFEDYKSNPNGYNPGQKDYAKLVRENAKAIINSPEYQQWYKESMYTK